VCHQTVSLVARHLEAAGITTVVIGSARDIVEECGVPRFLFVDFPLGNPCGKPGDVEMQRRVVELAVDLAASAIASRTTVQSPARWGSDDWRDAYMAVGDHNRETLRAAGDRRRDHQAVEAARAATSTP
jgi:D-proline reductase (dithiol) PrdB